MSDKVKELSDFDTPLIEASHLLRKLAEPHQAGESQKAALYRVGRKLPDWTSNRVRDIWNTDPRVSIKADEIGQLRKLNKTGAKQLPEETTNEIRKILEKLETLSSTIAAFMEETERKARLVDRRRGDINGLVSGLDNRSVDY